MKNIWYFVAKARRTLHMSQDELATKLGVTQGWVSRFERGYLPASPDIERKLRRVFGQLLPGGGDQGHDGPA